MSRTAVKAPTPAPTFSQKSTVSQVLVIFSGKGTPLMQCFGSFHTYKVSFQAENTKKWAACWKRENYLDLKQTSCYKVERLDNFSMKANQNMCFRFSDSRWSHIIYSIVPLIVPAGSDTANGFPLPYGSSPGTIWVRQRLWMCCACIGAVDQQDSSEPMNRLPNIWIEKAAAKFASKEGWISELTFWSLSQPAPDVYSC